MSTPVSQLPTVGKKELCALLKWSRPKLDRKLKEDPHFPVRRFGDQTGGWEFDPAAVRAYLGVGQVAERPSAQAPGLQAGGETVVPLQHRGEATARQKRDLLQAALLADKIKVSRGELVEAEAITQELTAAISELGQDLNGIPDGFVRRTGLTDPHYAIVLKEMIDEARRTFVTKIRRRTKLHG